MDKQADPVAGVAGDAASAASEADAVDRQPDLVNQPDLVKKASGKSATTPAEARPEPAAPAPEPSVFSPRPKPSNGSGTSGTIKVPSFLKGGRKRSDATVPMDLAHQAGVQKATGGLTSVEDDEPDVTEVSTGDESAESSGTQETTSALAAAALARELTGAGFATPGFGRPARPAADGSDGAGPGSDATKAEDAQSPSGTVPPASTVTPSSAVTNPAWTSPSPSAPPPPSAPPAQAGRPGSSWTSSNAGPAAPLGSGYGSPASSGSGTPPPAGQGAGSAAGTTAVFGAGAALGAEAVDHTFATPRAEHVSASPAGSPGAGYPPPVPSEDQRSRLGIPFVRPGKKKKLKPNAGAKPGGAIGNGKAPMSVKSKPTAQSRPAPQLAPASRPEPAGARDAQLVLSRVEPWSVMKFSFIVSLVGFVVLFIVVAVLFYALSTLGVFHSIEQTVGLVTSSKGNPGTNAASWFSSGTVLSYTLIAGTVDVILITALCTVGAVVYNAIARLTGGIEITLAEAD